MNFQGQKEDIGKREESIIVPKSTFIVDSRLVGQQFLLPLSNAGKLGDARQGCRPVKLSW